MPVADIKKKKPPVSQVSPDQVPGYNPPPGIAAGQAPIQTQQQFDAGAIIRGEHTAQIQAVSQPPPLPTLPVYRWVSRFIPAETIKDEDGQLEAGYWMTDLEQTANRVLGAQMVYVPGGVFVLARIQELKEGDSGT